MGYPYVYTSLAVLVTAGGLYAHRKMKFIRLQSFRESILWSFREWRAGYPVPALMDNWVNIDGSDDEYYQRWQHMRSVWYFLKPFFAARGYRLYEGRPKPCHPCELFPVPATPGVSGLPHPFARGGFKTDFEALFTFVSTLVWPARDTQGRDVAIKMVSAGPPPSDELKINQWLNSPEALADPRNHSIRVLDYIYYNDLTFIVMPRWSGRNSKFYTNVQLLNAMSHLLEHLDFLHENRIAHCDLGMQNTALNIMTGLETPLESYFLDATQAKYAIFDFGRALVIPRNMSIDDVVDDREFRHDVHPFKGDVRQLGDYFLFWVNQTKAKIPGIDDLIAGMLDVDLDKRLTAHQALETFRTLRARLEPDFLERELEVQP